MIVSLLLTVMAAVVISADLFDAVLVNITGGTEISPLKDLLIEVTNDEVVNLLLDEKLVDVTDDEDINSLLDNVLVGITNVVVVEVCSLVDITLADITDVALVNVTGGVKVPSMLETTLTDDAEICSEAVINLIEDSTLLDAALIDVTGDSSMLDISLLDVISTIVISSLLDDTLVGITDFGVEEVCSLVVSLVFDTASINVT